MEVSRAQGSGSGVPPAGKKKLEGKLRGGMVQLTAGGGLSVRPLPLSAPPFWNDNASEP
jgi:hypothetical protein